ncbi:flagellar biosynthetic protein FliO [Falsiroseomonas sp.]|uniref:flagellar biosynthetic protein FliO n=1 Tax=Falsiroseomonas sp. TaxID=2870721 RepID=UPI003F71D22E
MTETASLITATLTAAAALVAVLAALLLAGRAARAAGIGARIGRRLAVEETLALDGRRRLVLLRCDGRSLLLLTGGAQEVVLGWLPPEAPGPEATGREAPR